MQEGEAGRLEGQGHLFSCCALEASLGYIRGEGMQSHHSGCESGSDAPTSWSSVALSDALSCLALESLRLCLPLERLAAWATAFGHTCVPACSHLWLVPLLPWGFPRLCMALIQVYPFW